jgi:hypothetical protein
VNQITQMIALPPSTCRAVVVLDAPPAEATLLAVYSYRHLCPFHHLEKDVIGAIGYDPNDQRSMDRLLRMDNLLHARFGWQSITRDNHRTEALRERTTLSDLERFRRKMLKVVRQYEANKVLIDNGVGGLFQEERLRELDAELELAWQKMEDRYGCKREQLDDPVLTARAAALIAQGKLDLKDHFELS